MLESPLFMCHRRQMESCASEIVNASENLEASGLIELDKIVTLALLIRHLAGFDFPVSSGLVTSISNATRMALFEALMYPKTPSFAGVPLLP
jgi:hypothetical protein